MPLYVVRVRVEYEYAIIAKDDASARSCTVMREAMEDGDHLLPSRGADAEVVLAASDGWRPPRMWDDRCLVYGAPSDTTWAQAVAAEKEAKP